MKKILLYLLTLGLSLTAATSAKAQVTIDRIEFPNPNSSGFQVGRLYVPQGDTSLPAYGGRLTVREVDIAKMVEATHYACHSIETRHWSRIIWNYYVGANLRQSFDISCNTADVLGNAYGFLEAESTVVYYYQARNIVEIPVLNITGDNISPWKIFVGNLRSEGSD